MIVKKNKTNVILVFLGFFLFLANIGISIKNNSHNIFPSPITVSLNALAISIDEIVNGSKGYAGNRDLLEKLLIDENILKYNQCKKNS